MPTVNTHRVILLSVSLVLSGATHAYGQACPPFWQDADGGLSSRFWPVTIGLSFASFDPDGPAGPQEQQLFVGGVFNAAGDVTGTNIARWNGFGWMGAGNIRPESSFGEVYSLLSGPDLSDPDHPQVLYLAGIMSAIDFVPTDLVAKWDGQKWSSLGPIEGRVIFDMTMHDPDGPDGPLQPILVAVGQRRTVGGGPANPVAFWDGVQWVTPEQPVDDALWATASFDPDGGGPESPALFVNGEQTDETWEYAGSTWIHRPGAGGPALLVFDPDGDGPEPEFLVASGRGVRRMNADRSWSLVGDTMSARVLASWDPDGTGPY